jgi:hypothetical protein
MSPSPSLTDPDVRISRIRFFMWKVRYGGAYLWTINTGQRASGEHSVETRPPHFVAAASINRMRCEDPTFEAASR